MALAYLKGPHTNIQASPHVSTCVGPFKRVQVYYYTIFFLYNYNSFDI